MGSGTELGIALLVLGALVVVAELHSLTIYLIAIAVGLFAAGGLALAGGSLDASLWVLGLVIVLGLPVAHYARRKLKNREAERITNDDAGHTVRVEQVAGAKLRVRYRGSVWDARAEAGTPRLGGTCRIVRREGNVLVVVPASDPASAPAGATPEAHS